jgi:hypothetical protein
MTEDDIETAIASEHYFTASDAVLCIEDRGEGSGGVPKSLELVTFCVLVFRDGSIVTGEYICDPRMEIINIEKNLDRARENAINKVRQSLQTTHEGK